MCSLYVITNTTQVRIVKKKGKYGIKYSLASVSDGLCPHGWGGGLTLEMEFPHLGFCTLTTDVAFDSQRQCQGSRLRISNKMREYLCIVSFLKKNLLLATNIK